MTSENRHNEVPVASIPEVAAYEAAKERLHAFKEANKDFFRYLAELTEEHDARLAEASSAVRKLGVTCGDFNLYQFATKVDADAAYELLGHDRFLTIGGEVSQVMLKKLDKASVEQALSKGSIPAEAAAQILSRSPRYKAPKPWSPK